jgi:uncharacterized protein
VERYLSQYLQQDLKEKMVFLGGPRQVGKTTLALSLLKRNKEPSSAYLSWDVPDHQRLLLAGGLPADEPLLVLDEIHKYKPLAQPG